MKGVSKLKQLKENDKLTLADLADWFGISYSTIRQKTNREKKLKILKSYADYHYDKKFIIIDKVYIDTYSKAYDFIKQKLPQEWHKNGLDTCARVGISIHAKYPEVSSQIKVTSAKSYTNRAKIELFGRNHLDQDVGELGISRYCWGVNDKNGECHHLTKKQEEIVSECARESYGLVLGPRAALLNDALRNGEITEKEFCEGLSLNAEERREAFSKFEGLVFERLGFMPMRLTEITYGTDFNKN